MASTKNGFVWADLSTFDVEAARTFYEKVFGWNFTKTNDQSRDEPYHIASIGNKEVAALFRMPDFLQKIQMPSFWMSYLWVDDVHETVKKAKDHHNVIIEIEPTNFDEHSEIALIRDPAGAGFTVYSGPDLQGRGESAGSCIWNVLHVSDLGLVQDFYSDVFGWEFHEESKNVYGACARDETIAHIEVFSNKEKGEKQYWMPIFGVADSAKSVAAIVAEGGTNIWDMQDGRIMCSDSQGGTFLIQSLNTNAHISSHQSSMNKKIKWATYVSLAAVWFAVFMGWNWVWGIVFLLWILPDIHRGETYFVEYLSSKDDPLAFWLVCISWIIMAGFMFFM